MLHTPITALGYLILLPLLIVAAIGEFGARGEFRGEGLVPPADCYAAPEPTADGPNSPGNLEAMLPAQGPLGQVNLTWSDNSDNETCFVLETAMNGSPDFFVRAYLPASTTEFIDGSYNEGDRIDYRLYAATSSGRSGYSNVVTAEIPIIEPTPTSPPLMRADMNCNSVINARDSIVLLRYLAGLDPQLPFGCPGLDTIVKPSAVAAQVATGDVR